MKDPTKKDAKRLASTFGVEWREDAERTLLELQAELRARKDQLKNIELVGAIRMLAEALTTNRAALPDKGENAT